MRSRLSILVALVTGAASLPIATAAATAPLKFDEFERGYQWYGDTRESNRVMLRAIPAGTSFWAALEMLRAVGARCVGDIHDPSLARCAYSERIAIHDYYPADAIWTINVHLDDGKASSLTLTREVVER